MKNNNQLVEDISKTLHALSLEGSIEISGNARKVADFLSALDDVEKYLKMFQQNLSLMSDKGDVEN